MIGTIQQLLGYGNATVKEEDINKLYASFYGAYNLSNTVTWWDNKSEIFINEGYRGNAAVYSIVNKIMMKDSEPVLQAFKESGKKARFTKQVKYKGTAEGTAETRLRLHKDLSLVESGELAKLLARPNKAQTQYEFLQNLSLYWRLTGEVFIYGKMIQDGRDKGKFTEIFVLPSHLLDIVMGDMFMPIKGYKFRLGDQLIEFNTDEVLQLKTPNPNWNLQGSQLRGQGALLAGLKYLQKNTESLASLYRAVQNEGAKGFMSPYPVSNPELWFTPAQLLTLKSQIQGGIEGMMNKNKVAGIGVPMSYTDIGKSPTDLDTLKSMDADFKALCNLWGVNPAIFSDDPKYDNMAYALKSLVTDVSMPFLKQLEQGLSDWLLPRYKGEADYLEFDTSLYSELQPDVKLLMDTYGKSPAFTWNELRIMLGYDEIEGDEGNTHWIGTNLIPAQDALLGVPDFSADFPV